MFQIMMILQIEWKKYRTAQHSMLKYHAFIQLNSATPVFIISSTNSYSPGEQARRPSTESIHTQYGHTMTPPPLKKKQSC